MIPLYYLLYKLKNDDMLWIVRTSDILEELLEYTEKFKSDYEKYYLVERVIKLKYKEKELERWAFKNFELCKNDRIIDYTL
jgi:hypothetical protein|tara:strand:- start:3947 stop:4189 length:243 start_codon:yes stop_codon:yes gene_type:complete